MQKKEKRRELKKKNKISSGNIKNFASTRQ